MTTWTNTHLDELQAAGKIRGYSLMGKVQEAKQKQAKYKNKKVVIDGNLFDSKKEAARYMELKMMQHAGLISELRLQVPFVLIEKNGKEKGCKYVADFVYLNNGTQMVEDVKSNATRKLSTYILKRKLMLEKHSITIIEI